MKALTSLDAAPVGYYWLAVKGDTRPPRIVAVIEGPVGKAILAMGVPGLLNLPEAHCRLYGPLKCPAVPKWTGAQS